MHRRKAEERLIMAKVSNAIFFLCGSRGEPESADFLTSHVGIQCEMIIVGMA